MAREKVRVRQAAEESLDVIANLKVRQIARWRRERLADAALISLNPYNTLRIIPFLRSGPGGRRRRHPGLAGVCAEKRSLL